MEGQPISGRPINGRPIKWVSGCEGSGGNQPPKNPKPASGLTRSSKYWRQRILAPGGGSGSVRAPFGIRSGSVRDPLGVRSGSFRANLGPKFSGQNYEISKICPSILACLFCSCAGRGSPRKGPFGIRSGSVRVPFGPISDQNFRSQKFKISEISICAAVAAAGALRAAGLGTAARGPRRGSDGGTNRKF